jgi:small subunit ribosomal protein S6
MREYELMIITKPDIPEAELGKMIAKWEGLITSDGGQIIKKDTWGVKKLAYPIRKSSRGNYVVYDAAATQPNMIELDRLLGLDENVLRCMSIKLADSVDVAARKLQLQKQAEEAAQRAAEAARERADMDSMSARRGPSRDEE